MKRKTTKGNPVNPTVKPEGERGTGVRQSCTISITAAREEATVNISVTFDPPIENDDHRISTVEQLAVGCLQSITAHLDRETAIPSPAKYKPHPSAQGKKGVL